MPYKNENKQREYQRNWIKKKREVTSQTIYWRKIRQQVIQKLGGKCAKCGCDNYDALEINHLNGGGRKEAKKISNKAFYLAILNGTRQTDDLDIRCKVCNNVHYLKKIKKLSGTWTVFWKPN